MAGHPDKPSERLQYRGQLRYRVVDNRNPIDVHIHFENPADPQSLAAIPLRTPVIVHVGKTSTAGFACIVAADNTPGSTLQRDSQIRLHPIENHPSHELFAYTLSLVDYQPLAPLRSGQRISLATGESRPPAQLADIWLAPARPRTCQTIAYTDQVFLRAAHGEVLVVDGNERVTRVTGTGHCWQVVHPRWPGATADIATDGQVALLSERGTYLSAPPDGRLHALRLAIGPHEIFRVSRL